MIKEAMMPSTANEKNKIRPKVSQFSKVYNSIKARHQSGACENTIWETKYHTIYGSAFTMTACWEF